MCNTGYMEFTVLKPVNYTREIRDIIRLSLDSCEIHKARYSGHVTETLCKKRKTLT